jgi:peptidoglycan/xylan/chitin deacetylase (PgdA/CDA1 family)
LKLLAASLAALIPRRAAVLAALALAVLAFVPAARAETVVSLTFDDGIESQFAFARPQLNAHGMLGTFYINSGNIDMPGGYYMNWQQVDTLNAERHEIGGHTINHVRLAGSGTPPAVTPAEARRQICVDAATLRGRGYQVIDFAYPYGAGLTNSDVRQALADCAYVSARTYGDLRGDGCPDCVYAEPIPPLDPYGVRTPLILGNPLTLSRLQGWVSNAESNGGGWVPIVFHEIDHSGAEGTVSPEAFTAFLDWLQAAHVSVRTVRSVLGYPDPPVPEPPLPVRAFVPPADKATAFSSIKASKRQDIDKLFVRAAMIEPGTLSASATVNVSGASRVFKFKRVSKSVTANKAVKLRLRLSKKGLRVAKRALRRGKRLSAKIRVTAKDSAGNSRTAKRSVRLRR